MADLEAAELTSDLPVGTVIAVADPHPTTFTSISETVSNFGRQPLERVGFTTFRSRLLKSPTNSLFPFLDTVLGADGFRGGLDASMDYSFDVGYLNRALTRRGKQLPLDKEKLVVTYLAYLQSQASH